MFKQKPPSFATQTGAPTSIIMDALEFGVGAVPQQQIPSGAQFPTSRGSYTRQNVDIDRELLAIYLAIRHFRYFVEGRAFHVLTDHKPLTFALSSQSPNHSPRQMRHLDFIAQFTTDIRCIKGSDNSATDALSRVEVDSIQALPPSIDLKAMASVQRTDKLEDRALSSLKLSWIPVPTCNTTHWNSPPIGSRSVPQAFDVLHSRSH